jgi:hypothetical protein
VLSLVRCSTRVGFIIKILTDICPGFCTMKLFTVVSKRKVFKAVVFV